MTQLERFDFTAAIETPAWIASYRNQGLNGKSISSWNISHFIGEEYQKWWHFIYKMPRRY